MPKTIDIKPIFIQNLQDLKNKEPQIHWSQYVQFYCPNCNTLVERKLCRLRENQYNMFCRSCSWKQKTAQQKESIREKKKQTSLKKYGVENPMQSKKVQEIYKQHCVEKYEVNSFSKTKAFKEKITNIWNNKTKEEIQECVLKNKQTCLQRYGVDNGAKTKTAKEKYKQTCLEKYGVHCTFLDSNQKEKTKQTLLKRYGTLKPNSLKSIKDKTKQTMLEKYGAEYPLQSPTIQEKYKQTCEEKYNTKYPMQFEPFKEKARQCFLNKYEVSNPMQFNLFKEKARQTWAQKSPEELRRIRSKSVKKYIYKDQCFDSSWELAVWIWATEMGKEIKREPISLEYEFEGKTHTYYPDFEIDTQLIEIKGNHFFNKDGKMQNPFDHTKDTLFEAKHQCGLQHNIQFWTEKEVQPALDYMNEKYGKDWAFQFRKKN